MAQDDPADYPPYFMDTFEIELNVCLFGVKNGFYSEPPLARQNPKENPDPTPGDGNPKNNDKEKSNAPK